MYKHIASYNKSWVSFVEKWILIIFWEKQWSTREPRFYDMQVDTCPSMKHAGNQATRIDVWSNESVVEKITHAEIRM